MFLALNQQAMLSVLLLLLLLLRQSADGLGG